MSTDIVRITKGLLSNIEIIDNTIDNYFEPFKDYIDTAEDLFTPIKIVSSLYTMNKKRKFKNFLKFYANSLNSGNINDISVSQKMEKYLSEEKNFNFINDTIEAAINSKSIYGSMLLGYFAGNILNGSKIINYKELIIMEALSNLNDFEISNFAKIFSVADLSKEINIYKLKDELGPLFQYEISILKFLQLRIVDEAPIIISDNQKGRFISNEISEDIYMMIRLSGVESDLINY